MYKVLIVDDTKSWLMFHKETINRLYGNLFEITTAASAAEGIEIIKHNIRNPFDIVITDLQMESAYEPKLAGEWLIEQIQSIKECSNTKIIIISAMYTIEYIAKNYNVECLSKNLLINNQLLIKFMFEKLMPFLNKL